MDEIFNDSGEPIVDWDTYMRTRAQLGAGFARILSYFREDGDKSVAKIEDAMRRAEKVKVKELKADTEEIERDAEPFAGGGPVVVTPHT